MKSDLNTILKFVEKRPGMYLSTYSIYELATFISGYEAALGDNFDWPPENEIRFMNWIEHKYHISSPAWHWSRILHHVAGTEKKAVKLFFEIWPSYNAEKVDFILPDKDQSYEPPETSVTNVHWEAKFNESWNA